MKCRQKWGIAKLPSPAALRCVFFTQHLFEKHLRTLWEGCFFVAPWTSSANVCDATEGASPCRAVGLMDHGVKNRIS